jgi:UDP-3-O-[3-hydroxymyristoyl] glucosamine N-acyltransferase
MPTMDTRSLTAQQVAELVGGRLEGDPAAGPFQRVMDLASAGDADVVWYRAAPDAGGRAPSGRLKEQLASTAAGLLLLDDSAESGDRTCVRVDNPALAAAKLARALLGPERAYPVGIHPQATVEDKVVLGDGVSIGPGCVVRSGAHIGAGTVLVANVHVGEDARIGAQCRLQPGVVLYERVELGDGCTVHGNVVLGAPGFGYVWDGARHVPVPQAGGVRIGSGVELGAGTCVDAGTYSPTEIGDGCILDDQVMIGHNCRLGRAVVVCAQAGLSGGTIVEDGAILGGRVGTVGHLTIGAGAVLGGGTVVTGDVAAGARLAGYPGVPMAEFLKGQALLRRMVRGERRGS